MTGTFGIHTWDGQDFFDCDVIVLQRYMHMQVLPDMKGAQAAGQIILQDVDDWYWGLSEKNHAYQASNPNSNPQENINWYQKSLKSLTVLSLQHLSYLIRCPSGMKTFFYTQIMWTDPSIKTEESTPTSTKWL